MSRYIDADNLISRQAAIDAICEECHMETDYHRCEGYKKDSRWCEYSTALNDLPSAQPDLDEWCTDVVEVVRCKDCKYAEVADPEDSQDGYTCQFHRGSIWFSGSYCSWAERRNR